VHRVFHTCTEPNLGNIVESSTRIPSFITVSSLFCRLQVIEVVPEPNRTSHVALVGADDKLRYILATENMKRGDIIVTSSEVTRNAGTYVHELSLTIVGRDRLTK